MTKWTKLWILWAVLAVGGFFAIEMPAVLNDEPDDTLTEHVVEYVPAEAVFFPVFGALAIWMLYHFGVRYARKRKGDEPDE